MKKFTQKELDLLFILLDDHVDRLADAIEDWTDLGDEPPEFLLQAYAEHNDLRTKLMQMIR